MWAFSTNLRHSFLIVMLHLPRALHDFDKLLDSPSSSLDSVQVREGMEPIRDIGHHTLLIGLWHVAHILDVQQRRNADLFACDLESKGGIALVVALVELVEVDQIWTMDVQ